MNEELNLSNFYFLGTNWSLSIEPDLIYKGFEAWNNVILCNYSEDEELVGCMVESQYRMFIEYLYEWVTKEMQRLKEQASK